MGKGNNQQNIGAKFTFTGGSEAVGEINAIAAALAGMNAVAGGASSSKYSVMSANSPLAKFAPPAPPPPAQSASSPAFSANSSFNPASLPGLLGAGAYSVSSANLIPAAPPAPGQRPGGTSLQSGGFPGVAAGGGMPLHISATTVTISAQVVNLVGPVAAGGGGTSSGSGTGSSFGSGSLASGSGSLVPAAPAPHGSDGGSGGSGGGGGIPSGGSGGASWGNFLKSVQANPTLGGVLNAVKSEMPVGPAAAVTAAMYGFSYAGNAIYAGQRPGFETQLAQTSAMLHGQFTPGGLLAGQSRAAEIRGSVAFDKALLRPFDSVAFGLPSLAYDFVTGQPREEAAMRAEGDAAATQNIRQLSALGGIKNAELLRRFSTTTHQEDDLGFIKGLQRTIGKQARQFHAGSFLDGTATVTNSLAWLADDATFHLFSGAANNGVHDDSSLDENTARYLPSMIAMQRMALGMGQGFDDRAWSNPGRFISRFGTAFNTFGAEATTSSYGGVANAMSNDYTQLGLYKPGTNFSDPENVRLAARIAAGRGADITNFAPAFYQNGDMATFNSLRNTRRDVQMLENRGRIAGYETSTAQYGYQSLGLTGADYPALQKQIDVERTGIQASMRAKQEESRYAVTNADKARIESELAAFRVRLDSNAHQRLDVEFGARSTRLGAEGMKASTGFQQALYNGADADGLDVAFGVQANNSRSRAALLRKQAQRADIDPATRAQYAAQADAADFEANVMSPRQASLNRYGLDMSLAGVTGARAGQAGSLARLFGGPNEQAAAVRQEQSQTAQELKAVTDLLGRSGNSLEEIRKLTAQQINLQTRQVELAQEEIRGKAQAEYSLASGRAGLAGTEQSTVFTMGVGGAAGGSLAIGTLNMQKAATAKAQQYVALLKSQGVSANNPAFLAAQQQVASARSQEASLTVGLASTPYSVSLRRQEENASYQTDILSNLPGSYGNIRGSMRNQMKAYQSEGEELRQQYAQVVEQFGGAANVPEAVKERFESRFHQLGRSSASLAQSLAHGWESRLVSASLGTPGNFSYISNRFSTDRASVLNGVRNPHFGSTGADLGMFLHDANADAGFGMSLTGSTGTAEGFARTALTGAKQRNDFSEGATFPLFIAGGAGGANQGGMGAGAGRGSVSDVGTMNLNLNITLDNDGKIQNIREQRNGVRVERISLGANEDTANMFSAMLRGQ